MATFNFLLKLFHEMVNYQSIMSLLVLNGSLRQVDDILPFTQ